MSKLGVFKGVLVTLALAASPIALTAPPAGDTLDISEYRGKVVLLDFWASWCVPCRRSFPWLNTMHQKYAQDGLVIIGINVDQEPADAAKFLRAYPAQFEISYDTDGVLAKEYGVQAMPSSFVIGRDGQVKARHRGFKVKRQDEYEATIVATLQQEKVE